MKEITKENIEKLEEVCDLLSNCGGLSDELNDKKYKAEALLEELEMKEADDISWLDGFSDFESLACKLSNKAGEYEIELEFCDEEE